MSNKPITRKEMFMAKASGQNVNTPKPITREEKFLERIAKNGGKATSWKDLGEKTVRGDTLTWDGNTEGLYNVIGSYYHISDIVPTLEELQHGGTLTLSTNSSVSFDSAAVVQMGEDLFFIMFEGSPIILVTLKDNAILADGDNTMTIEKAGIYFMYENAYDNLYVTSFTINGYNGFPRTEITPIPEEYLPSPDMIIEMIGTCGFETSEDLSSYCQIVSGNVVEIRSKLKKGEPVEAVIIGDAMFVSHDPSSLTLKSITVADLHDYLLIGFIVTTTASTRRLRIAIDNDNNITMFESKSLD